MGLGGLVLASVLSFVLTIVPSVSSLEVKEGGFGRGGSSFLLGGSSRWGDGREVVDGLRLSSGLFSTLGFLCGGEGFVPSVLLAGTG